MHRQRLQTQPERRGEGERLHHATAAQLPQHVGDQVGDHARVLLPVQPQDQPRAVSRSAGVGHHPDHRVRAGKHLRAQLGQLLPPPRVHRRPTRQGVGEHLRRGFRLPRQPIRVDQRQHLLGIRHVVRPDRGDDTAAFPTRHAASSLGRSVCDVALHPPTNTFQEKANVTWRVAATQHTSSHSG